MASGSDLVRPGTSTFAPEAGCAPSLTITDPHEIELVQCFRQLRFFQKKIREIAQAQTAESPQQIRSDPEEKRPYVSKL